MTTQQPPQMTTQQPQQMTTQQPPQERLNKRPPPKTQLDDSKSKRPRITKQNLILQNQELKDRLYSARQKLTDVEQKLTDVEQKLTDVVKLNQWVLACVTLQHDRSVAIQDNWPTFKAFRDCCTAAVNEVVSGSQLDNFKKNVGVTLPEGGGVRIDFFSTPLNGNGDPIFEDDVKGKKFKARRPCCC